MKTTNAAKPYLTSFGTFVALAATWCGLVIFGLGGQLEQSLRRDELVAVERTIASARPSGIEDLAVLESALSWERHVVRLSWRPGVDAHPWKKSGQGSDVLCASVSTLAGGCVSSEVNWIPGLSMLGQESAGSLFVAMIALFAGLSIGFHLLVFGRFYRPLVAALSSREKSEAKLRGLDMIVHDLRKPMRAIRETLGEASANADAKTSGIVREICEAVDDMITDVDAMLRSAGTASNSQTVRAEKFAVEALIVDAFRQCAAVLQRSNCSLTYRLKHVRMLEGDRSLLGRMLANLVGNALEAVDDGGEVWFVTDEAVVESRPMLKLTVGNTGSPIAAADQSRVFGAFFTKGKANGTGLGLAFVRLVVETHGGRVALRSSKETGTEFSVTLPLAVGSLSKGPATLPVNAREAASLFQGEGVERLHSQAKVTILLVDDDVFSREAWTLECRDAHVVTLGSPEEVLSRMEADPSYLGQFVAIVTDYYFGIPGGLNGAQFAAKIRRSYHGPIVLASSATLGEGEEAALDLRIGKEPRLWADLSASLVGSVKTVGESKLG